MSALNCRPGDMAVLVRSANGNLGTVVEVISFVAEHEFLVDGGRQVRRDVWWCKARLPNPGNQARYNGHAFIEDFKLRPLRDPGQDAQDETLTWLPVPSTTKEAA